MSATSQSSEPRAGKVEREFIVSVVEEHIGTRPKQVSQQTGGLNNAVFAVNHQKGEYVVRVSPDADGADNFRKEQWAAERVLKVGVPANPVLHIGEMDGRPYMIAELVSGEEASNHPERIEVIRQLGVCAQAINSIKTEGIGSTFDWAPKSRNRITSWPDYLDKELGLTHRLDVLQANEMLSHEQAGEVRSALETISDPHTFLCHGDIRLKNVLVNKKGKINAIIDWDLACSNIAPAWDIAIALHDLGVDAKVAFLQGYGLTEPEMTELAPLLSALNVVNYAPYVESALKEHEDDQLEQIRLRLSGALDLYSF